MQLDQGQLADAVQEADADLAQEDARQRPGVAALGRHRMPIRGWRAAPPALVQARPQLLVGRACLFQHVPSAGQPATRLAVERIEGVDQRLPLAVEGLPHDHRMTRGSAHHSVRVVFQPSRRGGQRPVRSRRQLHLGSPHHPASSGRGDPSGRPEQVQPNCVSRYRGPGTGFRAAEPGAEWQRLPPRRRAAHQASRPPGSAPTPDHIPPPHRLDQRISGESLVQALGNWGWGRAGGGGRGRRPPCCEAPRRARGP